MDENTQPVEPKHLCGTCLKEFATEQEYLDHTCETTGHTPADFEHQVALNPNYEAISQAALERGAAAQAEAQATEEKPQE